MGLLGCKLATSPLEARPKFWDIDSPIMVDANPYWRLLGKLIYLTVTRLDITYAVSVLSQFTHEPRMVHWEDALRVLAYIKRVLGKRLIFNVIIIFLLRPNLMLDMLGIKEIKNLLQGIAHM